MASGVKVQLRVLGKEQLSRKLGYLSRELPGSLVEKERLGAFLVAQMKKRFRQGIDPDGNPWKPLSPRTKKGKGILRKTENLYKSIGVLQGSDRGGFGVVTNYGFRIGITSRKYMERDAKGKYSRQVDTAVYGRRHQIGGGNVPQRRFIGLSASDRTIVAQQLKQRLKLIVAKAKVVV